jgi:hypothetical protein
MRYADKVMAAGLAGVGWHVPRPALPSRRMPMSFAKPRTVPRSRN